jgi:Fic family protein
MQRKLTNAIRIGAITMQKEGFSAFIPDPFPVDGIFDISTSLLIKAAEADRLVGKLDGITHTLPDLDFFLHMFVAKDAASSSQIEGTRATIMDAIELEAGLATKETDAGDILYYIQALNYGIHRLKDFPLSLRLIKEIHEKLMTGARATHFADPGEFRTSQNWIGGTSPANAIFVPPPKEEMKIALSDLEKFLHNEQAVLPLIHIALSHAQFETIHPFLDGNGRTGRLLITMLLCHRNLLERPVLFLSSYFKKHQKIYYQKLNAYHTGEAEDWVDFFLDGVIDTANQSIAISKEIRALRDADMAKIQILAKRESESGMLVLSKLYAHPVVNTRIIMEWTGFSRPGAQKVIDRFVRMDILKAQKVEGSYDQTYAYERYLRVFVR